MFTLAAAAWAQREFRVYDSMEGLRTEAPLPSDFATPAEFVHGRLMYPSGGRRGFRGGGNWLAGRTTWTIDYPKGDRLFAAALRRLTRIDVRSVEQPVNPEDGDDIFYWPYLHVALPGAWNLTDNQASKLRAYLERGGFLMCDSFFGADEWQVFEHGIRQIFPDRVIEDIPDIDPILQTVFDIKERHQVAHFPSIVRAGVSYRNGGDTPYWRAVRDDKGRIMVAVCFNNDLGDSWHAADEPLYPEKYSALGIRIGVNYVVYAMSH